MFHHLVERNSLAVFLLPEALELCWVEQLGGLLVQQFFRLVKGSIVTEHISVGVADFRLVPDSTQQGLQRFIRSEHSHGDDSVNKIAYLKPPRRTFRTCSARATAALPPGRFRPTIRAPPGHFSPPPHKRNRVSCTRQTQEASQ